MRRLVLKFAGWYEKRYPNSYAYGKAHSEIRYAERVSALFGQDLLGRPLSETTKAERKKLRREFIESSLKEDGEYETAYRQG